MSDKKHMQDKKTAVRDHFRKHKKKYLIGAGVAVCVVVGVAIGYAAAPTIKGGKVAQKATIVGNKNVVNQTAVQVQMTRPGPKSFVVQCVDDGRVWPSIRKAAEDLDVSPSVLSGHLKGKLDDVSGLKFQKITEL